MIDHEQDMNRSEGIIKSRKSLRDLESLRYSFFSNGITHFESSSEESFHKCAIVSIP